MRFPVYSLRTGILAQLIFLIVAAMLLINVVMVKFAERDLIQAKMNTGQLLIRAVEQRVNNPAASMGRNLKRMSSDPQFIRDVPELLDSGGFSEMSIIDNHGRLAFHAGTSSPGSRPNLTFARKTIQAGTGSVDFQGSIWGVIWLSKSDIHLSAPLIHHGRTLGGVTVRASLNPIYQALRKSQKLVLLYILLDTIILAVVGIYLLSRIVVKPVNRLLKMTEEYKEGDFIPSLGNEERNELGKLSRSLNIMLKRLEENKKELQAHIVTLEQTNQELHQAQDELIRSEKLASVGRLAAGIAHEIGNPVGIVLGYLELLRKRDIHAAEKEDFLNRIESEITRINLIIRNLLDFSRSASGKKQKTRVHALLRDTIDMLKPQSMMEGVEIELKLEAADDAIIADPNQLQQVFLNIMMNAADSFTSADQGGSGVKQITIISRNTGSSIEFNFMDTGCGIPPEDLLQIFDPFYTTKEPGQGTGLGLSVCYRIIEETGGEIRAESTVSEGTRIRVKLPLDESERE